MLAPPCPILLKSMMLHTFSPIFKALRRSSRTVTWKARLARLMMQPELYKSLSLIYNFLTRCRASAEVLKASTLYHLPTLIHRLTSGLFTFQSQISMGDMGKHGRRRTLADTWERKKSWRERETRSGMHWSHCARKDEKPRKSWMGQQVRLIMR